MQYSNLINNGSFDFRASACDDPFTVINAEDNFWVATDSATIADEHIYDNSDDSGSPIVDFVPFLTEEIQGTLSGIVTDQMSDPIPDVSVRVVGTGINDYTDANGEYILDGLETDFHEVFFAHPDYSDTTIAGVFVRIGDVTILDVVMEVLPEPVPTLSEWGMMILALLLTAMGTVALIRGGKATFGKAAWKINHI